MDSVKQISLADIKLSGLNARKHFDEKKLQELTNSVKEKGVIEPIIVRPVNGKYEIVCGERRFRASQKADLQTIPALVRELSDIQALEFQVIENLHREDLDPMDEARGFKTMLEKCKYTQADLATKVGKSQGYIANRMRLLELSPDIQDAISREIITPGHGIVLLRLNDSKERANLFQGIVREKLSIRNAENRLDNYGRELSAAQFDKKDCATCVSNGSRQMDLFDKDTQIKGRCLNAECFLHKENQFINKRITELRKQGLQVVTQKKLLSGGGVNRTLLDYEYAGHKKALGKNYKEKCLKNCKNHYFVITKVEYGRREGFQDIEEWCINEKCFNVLTRPNTGGTGGNEDWKKDQDKRKAEVRVQEAKRRFWKAKILQHKTSIVSHATTLYFLCQQLSPYGSCDIIPKEGTEKRFGFDEYSIKSIYGLGEKKILELIQKAISMLVERAVNDDDLEFLTKELGFESRKDFVIDEAYLQAKTKEQIVKVTKEIGLDKFLKQKGICEPGQLGNKKKSELIDLFFNKGFDLKNKVPGEMVKGKENR